MTGAVVGRRTPTYARVDKPREAQTYPGRLLLMPIRLHKLLGRRCDAADGLAADGLAAGGPFAVRMWCCIKFNRQLTSNLAGSALRKCWWA